ncbi:hypothetical protein MASR1M32_23140 [Rhodobacter sp.]
MAALVLACVLPASPAPAQQRAVIEKTAEPPHGAASPKVEETLANDGSTTAMTYVTELKGDLAEGRTEIARPETRPAPEPEPITFVGNGSVSTVVIVLVLVAALLLWLRFGGAGMLLARAPAEQKKPVVAPEAWNITNDDQTGDPRSLIDQIAGMPDRAAALVRLLRHCLLTAAGETDTRLARADTERTAYRRLPPGWRAAGPLQQILGRAELAHYGGRPISDEDFAATLDLGRGILLRKAGAHG